MARAEGMLEGCLLTAGGRGLGGEGAIENLSPGRLCKARR